MIYDHSGLLSSNVVPNAFEMFPTEVGLCTLKIQIDPFAENTPEGCVIETAIFT